MALGRTDGTDAASPGRACHYRVRPAGSGLCCGTGAATRALAEGVPAGCLVVGPELSNGMLGQAVVSVRNARLTGIWWIQAEETALPFAAGTFDVVTCAYALSELKGAAHGAMLREVARLQVPDGRFVATEHEAPTRPLPRLLFFFRLAIIGAERARAFIEGEIRELGRVFGQVRKELVSPGNSKIPTGTKCPGRAGSRGAKRHRLKERQP